MLLLSSLPVPHLWEKYLVIFLTIATLYSFIIFAPCYFPPQSKWIMQTSHTFLKDKNTLKYFSVKGGGGNSRLAIILAGQIMQKISNTQMSLGSTSGLRAF